MLKMGTDQSEERAGGNVLQQALHVPRLSQSAVATNLEALMMTISYNIRSHGLVLGCACRSYVPQLLAGRQNGRVNYKQTAGCA